MTFHTASFTFTSAARRYPFGGSGPVKARSHQTR